MLHRTFRSTRQAIAPTKRPRQTPSRLQIEPLEQRALLSTLGPHPRLLADATGPESGDGVVTRIVNGTSTSSFPSVGIVGDAGGGFCTGTLIAPRYVLTAAHCTDGLRAAQGRFTVAGSTFATSQITAHPDYNGNRIGSDSANDIAIMQLASAITTVTPSPIFRGVPAVGQVLTLVGFGAGGNGTSGHNGDFGTKRVGTTPIDQVTSRLIHWRFDNNSESNTAPGDSGGPAFLDLGGVFYVAGVTSGGDRADAGIGDNSFDTRVDAYAAWIDSVAGTSPSTDPTPQPQPQPPPSGDDHANAPGNGTTALPLQAGTASGTGKLEQAGDRDVFHIQLAQPGSVTIDLRATDSSLDTYLRLYDQSGQLVAENDDVANSLNSRVTATLASGLYYVSAGSYADSVTGSYKIDVQVSADDHGNSIAAATPVALFTGNVGGASGAIESAGDRDFFTFVATSTGAVTLNLRASAGSRLDTMLTLYNDRGVQMQQNDDWYGTDSRIRFQGRAGTTYYVQASGYSTSTGSYALSVGGSTGRAKKQGRRGTDPAIVDKAHALPAANAHETLPDSNRRNERGSRRHDPDAVATRHVTTQPSWSHQPTQEMTSALDLLLADSNLDCASDWTASFLGATE